jgi:hypothetical protein
MGKFKKKPVVIEAKQWDGTLEEATSIIDWILENEGVARYSHYEKAVIGIDTLEGTMLAQVGDWIIKGLAGEFYPCKNEIFKNSYEQVDW